MQCQTYTQMTLFDLVVLALTGMSVVAGALRGLVQAMITIIALIGGIIIAAHGYKTIAPALREFDFIESPEAANASAFLLIAGITLLFGFTVGVAARGGLRRANLEWFDRVLGGAFGLIRGVLLCSLIYLALTAFPVNLKAVTEARTAFVLSKGARVLAICASPEVRARFISRYKRLTS